jgi:rhodanese-related sulfurtransferase
VGAPPLDSRGLPLGYPFKPELEVSAREVGLALATKGLGGDKPLLIDVRTPEEWDAAHIPGAVLIPLPELEARIDEIDADKDAPIAVLCHHGARSLRGALILRALGFTNARSIVGGIDLWSIDVDPAIPRYRQAGGRIVRAPSAP